MGEWKRFEFYVEKHIGIGVRWDHFGYAIRVSVALPFVTMVVGIGSKKP